MNRELIRAKFGGRCAYCGRPLGDVFHIDHVAPIFRGWDTKPSRAGEDTIDNLVPACPRCNRWKSTYTLEDFRFEISKQIERMRRDSPSFRLAEDFGRIIVVNEPVVFWFEKSGIVSTTIPRVTECEKMENIDMSNISLPDNPHAYPLPCSNALRCPQADDVTCEECKKGGGK